jgi:hypothetical protein
MPVKKIDVGLTGMTVADNIRRTREAQRLGFTEISQRLSSLGRPIAPLGLRRIESGERRIDVDDLLALAVALGGVSPVALLAPPSDSPQTKVEATATGKRSARALREWLCDYNPLEPLGFSTLVDFAQRSWPKWALDEPVFGLTDRLQELRRTADAELERRRVTKKGRKPADGDN